MQMPGDLGPIHILGIGGIGMSAIAEILRAKGFTVQGTDQKESANVKRLRTKGIKVFIGHQASNVEGARFVVISTAVKSGNPELEAARASGEMLRINVLGLVSIARDVTPELALATIFSLTVLGALHASAEVKAALADRIV